MLVFVERLLAEHEIEHWLDFGTLLGAVRGGEFIPWDLDVDLGIHERDAATLRVLRPEIEAAGYFFVDEGSTVKLQYSETNTLGLDIYAWTPEGELLAHLNRGGPFTDEEFESWTWPGMNGRTQFPMRYVERFEPVSLYGHEFPAPSPVEEFLADYRYGSDWMTPVRPLVSCGLGVPLPVSELTPAANDLLPLVRARSERLIELVDRSRLAPLARRTVPGRRRWLVLTGLPQGPEERHLIEVRRTLQLGDANDPAVEKLVRRLGWIERGIESYERPASLEWLRRLGRRMGWVVAGLKRGQVPDAAQRVGYFR